MLNLRPSHWHGVFVIVCYHYGDGGVVFPYAGDEVFQFVIAQEGLCGDGHKRAYIVLYGNTHMHMKSDSQVYKHHFKLTFLGSRIVKFWNGSVSNFDGEKRSMSFGSKLNCGEETKCLDDATFHISEEEMKQWKLLQPLPTLSNCHTIKVVALHTHLQHGPETSFGARILLRNWFSLKTFTAGATSTQRLAIQ